MLETNTVSMGGGGVILHKVTLLTVHHFSVRAMLLSLFFSHLFAIFVHVQKHFSFFLLVKHKTVCGNISFLQELLLKKWIACRYSTSVLSVKAEFHILTTFVINASSDKWGTEAQKGVPPLFRLQPARKNNIKLMWRDWTTLVSVTSGCN